MSPAIGEARMMDTLSEQQATVPARDLAIYRSPRRNLLLAVLAGAAACIAIPFMSASHALVQIAGLVWLGLCAHAWCGLRERAVELRPIVRIDGRGILDTRLLPRPIEWREIEFFYPIDVSRSRVVELQLRHPHRTLAEAPWHMRVGLDRHRQLDLPHVCISLLLLDGTATEVIKAIRCHAPHLVPRTKANSSEAAFFGS
jgi:hypothetical protein